MRNVEVSDWLAISLRWLTLVGIGASLIGGGGFSIYLSLACLTAAFWNAFLTGLAAGNRRLPFLSLWSAGVDTLVANLLFYFSSALAGPLFWVGLLPAIPAALSLRGRSLLVIILLSVATLGAQAFWFESFPVALLYVGVATALSSGVGFAFNWLGERIVRGIQQAQRERMKARQEAGKAERERRSAIFDLIFALSSTLNYQRVLDMALDMTAQALTTTVEMAEQLVSAVLLFGRNASNETCLQVASARRFTPSDLRTALPAAGGLVGQVIEEGEARASKNVSRDPELTRIVALRACKSAYCVPLRAGLEAYGVLLFAHPEIEFFTQERREVLDIVGSQAVIAIQNARLYRDLKLEKEKMTEVQEESRKKLARDLHDGPTQSVSALAMRVNFARRLMERDPKAASEELFKVEDLARRTTKEIRHMLFTLRPLILESQGLIAALESMAEKMRETYSQNVLIAADPTAVSQLEMGKQGVIFYIAEEAVNNARKHAQAEQIWVRIKPVESEIMLLEIEDNGVGFDVSNVNAYYESRGSLGMVNMRERAELVNGILSVNSAKGQGTKVRLLIPLTEEASERLRRG